MPRLPQRFNNFGLLPPGDYDLTIAQLRGSMLVTGPRPAILGWDAAWRRQLVDKLAILVGQLRKVEITTVFIDGSFVEDKCHPNDIDGYFECDVFDLATGALQTRLNLLDPHKVWTWDHSARHPDPDSDKRQLPMWHIYRVELYPHYNQFSGIVDAAGNALTFPSAFRKSRREDRQKGIVRIV